MPIPNPRFFKWLVFGFFFPGADAEWVRKQLTVDQARHIIVLQDRLDNTGDFVKNSLALLLMTAGGQAKNGKHQAPENTGGQSAQK